MTDTDIQRLREKTQQTDRLSENIEDDDEEEETEYTSIDGLILRKTKEKDVENIKTHTSRDNRIEESDTDQVKITPIDELDLEVNDLVDEAYCGNCKFVDFVKREGKPQPHCNAHDKDTRLETDMVCGEYDPQVIR